MGTQPAQISIPKPCHEDWNKMTPNEKGSFCSKCSKTVIDFTKKTADEIAAILESSGKKICGRFRNEQLDQTYPLSGLNSSINFSLRRMTFSNAFVVVLFIVFGTTLFSCQSHQEETKGKIQTDSIGSNIVLDSLIKSNESKILNDTTFNNPKNKAKANSKEARKPNNDGLDEHMTKGEVVIKPKAGKVKDTAKIDSAGILPKVGELKIYRGHDQ
ncbi:MAG: hypothetical protein V4608_02850 [Bacteroidota bacterium]